MTETMLAVNSVLLILATIFLIIAIGHAILTLTWTMLIVAAVIFVVLLISEIVLGLFA